jgi:hypothetical protein
MKSISGMIRSIRFVPVWRVGRYIDVQFFLGLLVSVLVQKEVEH